VACWTGRISGKPTPVDAFGNLDALDHFHAEAIVPLLSKIEGRYVTSDRVLILSDDGKRPIGGTICQKLLPEEHQFFRGIVAELH
jgi:hypothetical protein